MYNKILLKSVWIILSFFSKISFCEEIPKNSSFSQAIQESKLSGLGIVVSHKNSNEVEYSLSGDRFFIPASLSKIVTASALYEYFNPSHRFETSFFVNQPLSKEGVLNGDLYLKGGGDPSFVSETLWNLVNHLKRTGVRQVGGNLIVDEGLFKAQKSKKRFSFDRSYNSPLSALSFNWNSMSIYIRPGLENQKANVLIEPQTSYVQVNNKTVTQKGSRTLRLTRKNHKTGKNILDIKGRVPLGSQEFTLYRNISHPSYFTGFNALEFLKKEGIQVMGEIKKGRTPLGAQKVAWAKGQNISQLVQGMMKYSNNFIANMLVIQLSLLKSKDSQKAHVRDGLTWVRKFLDQKGFKGYRFVEPAGLSRKNRFTPQQIFKILVDDLESPYSFEKLASYPLAGGEGTLKKRFREVRPYQVRAKTGRLSGVDGLAGYVVNKQGDRRIFVFIHNGSSRNQVKAQNLFDQLVHLLIEDKVL